MAEGAAAELAGDGVAESAENAALVEVAVEALQVAALVEAGARAVVVAVQVTG